MKQNKNLTARESEELKKDLGKLEKRIEDLAKFEEECHQLQEENSTLIRDSHTLQEQFESVIMEKENLEYQTQEVMQALSEEKEAKSLLETKLMEDSLNSTLHKSWEDEEKQKPLGNRSRDNMARSTSVLLNQEDDMRPLSSPAPGGEENRHSTPFHAKAPPPPPSLLSEIQESFVKETDNDKDELEALRRKLTELEGVVSTYQKEKKVLEGNVAAASVREMEQLKDLESFRDEFARGMCEKDKTTEELNQRVLIRNEQIEQFRGKLSTTQAEKTTMEIEVDGLTNEIQRLKVVHGIEMDKIQQECAQEQTRNIALRSQVSVLEGKLQEYTSSLEKLENIIYNSQTELSTMTDDIRSLQKVVSTLNVDGRPSPTGTKPLKQVLSHAGESAAGHDRGNSVLPVVNGSGERRDSQVEEEGEGESYYSLKIRQRKSSVLVHRESHSLQAILNLRRELKSVRSPMEQFTKIMLERSLIHSARHAATSPTALSSSSSDHMLTNRKNTLDLEATISKWKSKFMHKTEELSNLRSIMKARATTAEVAVSSLRSELAGKDRAFQTELTKMKYQIKILKKERDEHLSLRTMYAKRCEDYIDEITKAKKGIERRNQDCDELMVSLQKTIQRKLELSTELEEYKMEQERKVLIPRLLEASRV